MAAETAKQFEALEAQAQKIMQVFIAKGYEAVAPAVLQPAAVFLDAIGEELRARTYVFTDANGEELCLRPDLTVPTCRLYLERHPDGAAPARYCYNGAAFRFQPLDADRAHPREFRQAGIESFGDRERERAEAETVAIVLDALAAAGLRNAKLRIGDLGLIRALLASLEMPERWRQLLMHRFWRRKAFDAEIKRLSSAPGGTAAGGVRGLIGELVGAGPDAAEAKVASYLEREGIELVGARTLSEIAERLRWMAADAKATPLAPATGELIERYLGVRAPALEAAAAIDAHVRDRGPGMTAAAAQFERRLRLLETVGVDLGAAEFSAEFGRSLEYYTGFVFEVVVPSLGPTSPVAGGGRYDSLVRAAGASRDVPAVGAAIHTERLLAAVNGGAP